MRGTDRILEFPGFVDVHVHFRDPGVPKAETTASGLAAARAGGFGAVVTMPNTSPACDSVELMDYQRRAAAENPSGTILWPSACITKGRLGKEVADLEALAAGGAAFFTDDGTYVSDAKVMEAAMKRAYDLNFVISQHALQPGVFTEAEAIARDLSICRVTGCRLHIQHISTAAGVELVRAAQREGLPVTAEAMPHHLLLCQDDIIPAIGGNFKMAPPLATAEDRAALRRAVKDGVLMFATDHAPHPAETKNCGYEKAANGIIGLEVAIPITYQVMVEEEGMSVRDWAEAWWKKPLDIINPELLKTAKIPATRLSIVALKAVDVESFVSKSRNCPYHGRTFRCWPVEDKSHVMKIESITKPLPIDTTKPLEIEVGCGKGKFLTARAEANPDCEFLGIERMLDRVRLFDGKCRRRGIDNAKVLRLEALYAFHYLLPDHHARRVYVFFPDPWPKKKHHSHRLFGPLFRAALWKRLEIGGKIEFATDHQAYFEEVCEGFSTDTRFKRVDPMPRPKEVWTEFETMFREQGLPIYSAAWEALPSDDAPLAPLTIPPELEPREGVYRRDFGEIV